MNHNRIFHKFNQAELAKIISACIPDVTAKFTEAGIVLSNANGVIAKFITVNENTERFEKIETEKPVKHAVFLKKTGCYHRKISAVNREINLDEYVFDANGIATPRYVARAITPQERSVLASYGINAGLLPQGLTDKVTSYERAAYGANLTNEDVKKPKIQAAILQRFGTRRLICTSVYFDDQAGKSLESNCQEEFFKDASSYSTYQMATPLRKEAPASFEAQSGGMILIDLAQIPQEKIFTLGKRDASIKLEAIAKKNVSKESETADFIRSSYRNHEIQLGEVSPGSILGWIGEKNKPWQTIVTMPLVVRSGKGYVPEKLTIAKIEQLELGKYSAYIKPITNDTAVANTTTTTDLNKNNNLAKNESAIIDNNNGNNPPVVKKLSKSEQRELKKELRKAKKAQGNFKLFDNQQTHLALPTPLDPLDNNNQTVATEQKSINNSSSAIKKNR